jgi:hypothetical protein
MILGIQVRQGVRGEPPTRFGYFSARESNARPGEGQTENYAKSKDKMPQGKKHKSLMNDE